MPTISPISDEALSVVMVQFEPHPAADREGVENNIKTICDYVDRAVFSFPGNGSYCFPRI